MQLTSVKCQNLVLKPTGKCVGFTVILHDKAKKKYSCVSGSLPEKIRVGRSAQLFYNFFVFIYFKLYQFRTEMHRPVPMTGKIISQNTSPAHNC